MSKKSGGYQILDITKISLTVKEDDTAITDAEILTTLKDYLLPYVKDVNQPLKPIYLRLVEQLGFSDVVLLGSLSRYGSDNNQFLISGKLPDSEIRINVELEQDEETMEWLITATWIYIENSKLIVEGLKGQNIEPGNVESSGKVTGNEIIENMSGYSFTDTTSSDYTMTNKFASAVKNGNKLTLVYTGVLNIINALFGYVELGRFTIPTAIGRKLIPTPVGDLTYVLDCRFQRIFSSISAHADITNRVDKVSNTQLSVLCDLNGVSAGTYTYRYEVTFLLGENLATNE